jgi:hypothetical protein
MRCFLLLALTLLGIACRTSPTRLTETNTPALLSTATPIPPIEPTATDILEDFSRESFRDLFALEPNLYLLTDSDLVILDVSDASQPTVVGRIRLTDDPNEMATDIYVAGNNAHITMHNGVPGEEYILVVDVDTSTMPVVVSHYGEYVGEVVIRANYAYVSDIRQASHYLMIYDLSDITNPVPLTNQNVYGEFPSRELYVDGHYAYVSDGIPELSEYGVRRLDISDPLKQTLVNSYLIGEIEDLVVMADVLYFASPEDTNVRILPLPLSPQGGAPILYLLPAIVKELVASNENTLYVLAEDGVHMLDVSQRGTATERAIWGGGRLLAVGERYVYVLAGHVLYVLDERDSNGLVEIGRLEFSTR